jgi:sugar/nucleoside kinase (ribokinase family)
MTLPTASPVVVSLGAHILDILGRPVTAIPPGQGSALLTEIRLTAAGTAAGTSVDLAKLGARVVAMGAIGADDIGGLLVSLLTRHGVDAGRLARVEGVQTSATMLPIRPNGERPALHVPGATPLLRLQDVDLGLIAAADVLHVGGPDVLGRFAGGPLARVLAAARDGGTLVTMDLLRPGSPEVLERLAPLLPSIDYFLPNSDQLLAITGAAGLDGAIKTVLAAGVTTVAVTMGAGGSRVCGGGAEVHIPALPAEVVDTTGCGDAYSAGFIVGICRGWDAARAAWLGTAAAALVAQGLGSDATLTGLDQALAFLRSHTAPAVPVPAGTAPGEPARHGAAHAGHPPAEAVPGQAVPGQAVPGQAVPGQAASAQAAPGQETPDTTPPAGDAS